MKHTPMWEKRRIRFYLNARKKPPKPHLYKQDGKWFCRTETSCGKAAKPTTAYKSYMRNVKWHNAGCPGRRY